MYKIILAYTSIRLLNCIQLQTSIVWGSEKCFNGEQVIAGVSHVNTSLSLLVSVSCVNTNPNQVSAGDSHVNTSVSLVSAGDSHVNTSVSQVSAGVRSVKTSVSQVSAGVR